MTVFEYICDHSYSLISVASWLIVIKIIEKYNFYNYIGYNKYHLIQAHAFRCVLSVMSYAYMGHGMYLIAIEGKNRQHIIIAYFLQLFLEMSWFIVLYTMNMLRTSAIISVFNILLSIYNFLTWYSMGTVIGICILPCIIVSFLNLLFNYNIISATCVCKSEKPQ
ncbi:hypothetical protein fep_039 [Pigeonpox virus]|uniref:Uncharacterized protein n=1 Tax=Pigeonpox virus TaxID=10264 RepID=A0A068EKM7_9POXV|nr:hypothetical protein HM89_gp040 [Pigeonpox virus]AID46552.1 hypothetical protein fep_039 [Pigeonpox virus]WCL39993.1 hypothetical protein [Pigeonpox virus]